MKNKAVIYNFQENHSLTYTERIFREFISKSFTKVEYAKIIEALQLAKAKHRFQKRSDGNLYIIHPIRVALLLLQYSNPSYDILITALLHDTLEDTDLTELEVCNYFGEKVLEHLKTLTRYRPKNQTPEFRKMSKLKKSEELLKSSNEPRLVKTFDHLDNMISWKFIKKGSPDFLKISRWLMEANKMYLPLAHITNSKVYSLMKSEIKYYKKNNYLEGDWFSDIVGESLTKIGNILVDTTFNKKQIGPSILSYRRKSWYRFMDFFYLTKKVINLSENEIIEVCDLRLKYLDKVVDIDFNNKVRDKLLDIAFKNSKITLDNYTLLEFGCGNGTLLKFIETVSQQKANLIGVDISKKAITIAKKKGVNAILINTKKRIPIMSESVDIVVSLFVMHFNITEKCLFEINRVLKKKGVFVFNFYNINDHMLVNNYQKYGFKNCKVYNIKHHLPVHKIILLIK